MASPRDLTSRTSAAPRTSAYEAVRRAILNGLLRPGERIVEERLAKSLGVSRTPVREALLRLETEHLVARTEHGLVVASFSPSEVRDLYDLRADVESYAAGLAAERAGGTDLDELEALHSQMVNAIERPGIEEIQWLRQLAHLNGEFHIAVARAARHRTVLQIVPQLIRLPLLYKGHLWFDPAEQRRSLDDHGRVLEAIRARDADTARDVWRTHLLQGRDLLVTKLREEMAAGTAAG